MTTLPYSGVSSASLFLSVHPHLSKYVEGCKQRAKHAVFQKKPVAAVSFKNIRSKNGSNVGPSLPPPPPPPRSSVSLLEWRCSETSGRCYAFIPDRVEWRALMHRQSRSLGKPPCLPSSLRFPPTFSPPPTLPSLHSFPLPPRPILFLYFLHFLFSPPLCSPPPLLFTSFTPLSPPLHPPFPSSFPSCLSSPCCPPPPPLSFGLVGV